MPHSRGDSAGRPDTSSDSSDSTGARLSASMHNACAHSTCTHTKTGSHMCPAIGMAVDSAAHTELTKAQHKVHAHKQANCELQQCIAELE